MIGGIPEKNTRSGWIAEFVCSYGCLIQVAEAAKNPEMTVIRCDAEEELERGQCSARLTWPPIQQMHGGGNCLNLERIGHIGLTEKTTDAVIHCANDSLKLSIL